MKPAVKKKKKPVSWNGTF